MMLRNFRLVAAQSSPVSPLGQLDYREGWFAIIPKEDQPGETLCGLQVHLNDKSLAEFPNRDWPAIEQWAERGLLKPDVWKARRTNLSLIVKLEIPISGTAIQVQQQALQLDQVPDSWPCNLESGWAAHYVKTHLEECTTRYLGFKCFLFSVYRVYPEVEDGRGTFDLACAFAVLFGVWKPGSVLLTAEVVW